MTTTTADWSHLESSVSISLPADVSNSDLFGGDLFGDELIDMYGATTVSETEPSMNHGILQESSENKPTAIDNSNNAGQVMVPKVDNEGRGAVAALDGLGAFRPCTSFNDFAELLPPSTTPVTAAGSVPVQVPVSPATVSVSDSSATLEHQASQPILSYVAGSSTTNNASDVNSAVSTVTKNNMTLAGKNHAAVVPSSLLPTGTGVKVNQQAAFHAAAAAAAASQGHTPDPLEAQRHRIIQYNRTVSNNTITPTATRIVQRSTPDQVKSQTAPTTVQASDATAPTFINNNAQLQTKSTTSATTNAISQATITAAAVAAATSVPTAADFTAVAQAAVSNLIMSAGAHPSANASQQNLNSSDIEDNKIVAKMNPVGSQADISTAHVTALTSSNWVSAVNNNTHNTTHSSAPTLVRNNTSIASASTHSLDQHHSDPLAPAAKRRRQNLTPDERAKQNRDRNREHARNTRLRKKAYVEELKRTLTELVTQRDATDMEQRRVAQRELEQREVRFRVAEEFMKLRGDNQRSTARWAAILENEFTLILPVTKYRNMVLPASGTPSTQGPQQPGAIPRQVSVDENRTEQSLHGVEEAKTDAQHLASFLERLYFPDHQASTNNPNDAIRNISIVYDCNRKNFFMDGTSAFLNWTATTHFYSDTNLPPLTFKGVLRAIFSPASNKLLSAELHFDTGVTTSHIDRIQSLMQTHHGAAAEADAILDSLEMPYFLPTNIGTTISGEDTSTSNDIVSNHPASITSSEKSDSENEEDGHQHVINDMAN